MKNTFRLLILLLNIFCVAYTFSQDDLKKYENEIAALNGKAKFEKYIKIIGENTTRSPQLSIKLGEKAIKEIDTNKFTSQYAKLLHLTGDSYYLTGEYPKAFPLLEKSAKIYEKLNDIEDLPLVYISIGRFYRKVQNDCENAKNYYHKAETIYENTKNRQELATVHNYLGNVTETCDKDLEKALSYYYKTEKYYQEVKDTIGLSYSLDFISQVLGQQGKFEDAIQKQSKALELRLAIKDSFAIAISYTNLGEIHLMQNNNPKSKENFEKAYRITNKLNYNDLNVYLLGRLSDLCYEQKDFECALNYLKLQKEVADKMLNEQKHKQIAEMTTKFETEKKELELEDERIKNKNKTLLLILLVGAILVLIIVISLIIQRRKMDRQKSTIANLQNLESERTRIARDLHDNLGAELTMISSKLDMKAFRTTNEADKKDLADIREISTNANFVLRETIWSIHKEELTIDELYHKAEEYATRILGGKAIRVSVIASNKSAVLSPALALHLFRIIQESVNNASKYADCSELRILINEAKVEIVDNGRGFDAETVQKGYGLQNMQQRAKEFNGTIRIETEAGKGTSVIVEF